MKIVDGTPTLTIPADIAAKCDGPDQFETFDRGVRAFLSVPKSAVLKDEAKAKRNQQKKRTSKSNAIPRNGN